MRVLILIVFLLQSYWAMGQFQSIDDQLLSELIREKQNEVETRLVQNLALTHMKPTNDFTFNTIFQSLRLLTQEKNKHVLSRDLVRLMAEYALVNELFSQFVQIERTKNVDFKATIAINGKSAAVGQNSLSDVSAQHFALEAKHRKDYSFEIQLDDKDSTAAIRASKANFLIDTIFLTLTNNPFLRSKGFFSADWHIRPVQRTKNDTYIAARAYYLNEDKPRLDDMLAFFSALDASVIGQIESLRWIQSEGVFGEFLKEDKQSGSLIFPYQQVVWLKTAFKKAILVYRDSVANNQLVYTIGIGLLNNLQLIDLETKLDSLVGVRLDASALILALADKYLNKDWLPISRSKVAIGPLLNIGVNHAVAFNPNVAYDFGAGPQSISSFSFLGEKIGIEFTFIDRAYRLSHQPYEWYQYKGRYIRNTRLSRSPTISSFGLILYGSGLVYNLVNVKSEQNFNYVIAGSALAVKFFNGMQLSAGLAAPLIAKENFASMSDKAFLTFSFDIPLISYLQALSNSTK